MLTRELADLKEKHGIESEVVYGGWLAGIKKSKSDFVLLLELDSAIERGNLARMFEPLVNNPHYRKLSMVTPKVEFDDSDPMVLSFMQVDGSPRPSENYQTRIGTVAGSLIRRHSLLKHIDHLSDNIIESSYAMSVAFWDSGLRILHTPDCLYYSPKSVMEMDIVESVSPSSETVMLWNREAIL